MRTHSKILRAALLTSILALSAGAAQADRGGHFGGHFGGHRHSHGSSAHFAIGFGFPLFWPWYEPGYAYYPRTVVVPAAPPVYVERGDGPGAAPAEYYWYYCDASRAYYPYVSNCATPWQRVTPTPPDLQ